MSRTSVISDNFWGGGTRFLAPQRHHTKRYYYPLFIVSKWTPTFQLSILMWQDFMATSSECDHFSTLGKPDENQPDTCRSPNRVHSCASMPDMAAHLALAWKDKIEAEGETKCTALGADSGRLVIATRPMLHNGNGGNEANVMWIVGMWACGTASPPHGKPLYY